MTFGTRLEKELEDRNMRQAELARQLGLSRTAISQWVNDQTRPGKDTLIRLEDLLGLPRGELLAMLGYRNPDDQPPGLLTIEEAIRLDDTIAAEDKRALLRIVAGMRRPGPSVEPTPASDTTAPAQAQ